MFKRLTAICLFQCALCGQPITGQSSAGTAGLDTVMQGLLSKYSIPGAALAVSRNGALVYARGFGYADTAGTKPAQPDSLFRIGSVSKTFTAIAIMELVEQGKIQLDQSAFALLPNITPLPGATLNPQLASVTVRQLLNMTGGWDRSIVPDAIDNTLVIAAATGFATPLSCSQVIQYQLSQPLQHAPGATYAYSNFGYCILGEIVAQVSGTNYVEFVRQNVLTPLGIQRAKQADPFLSDTINGEVTYYDYPGAPLGKNVYNPAGPLVPQAYGNHNFLDSEAAGAWVTTPIELLRFVNGIDGVHGGPLLQPATIQLMQTEEPAFAGTPGFYGLGFDMHTAANGGLNWFKDGGLPGTAAYLFKGANKMDFAVVFNSAPSGALDDSSTNNFESDYVAQIQAAIAAVTTWPTTDQFTTYASTLVPPSFRTSAAPVEDAASGLPSIVPGAWISIYGSNLATGTRTWYASEFKGNLLPLYVDGVSVIINGQPAPVYYVSPTQLDVQVPLTAASSAQPTVVVIHDGQTSSTVRAHLVGENPALFTYSADGLTFAAAVASTGIIVGDPSVEPGTAKVRPGDYVELYVNSMLPSKSGAINPPNTLQTFPTVTIGGMNAPVSYAGLVGPGLIQVNVQVPPAAAAGNQQVLVTYNGVTSPNGVMIPIGN